MTFTVGHVVSSQVVVRIDRIRRAIRTQGSRNGRRDSLPDRLVRPGLRQAQQVGGLESPTLYLTELQAHQALRAKADPDFTSCAQLVPEDSACPAKFADVRGSLCAIARTRSRAEVADDFEKCPENN